MFRGYPYLLKQHRRTELYPGKEEGQEGEGGEEMNRTDFESEVGDDQGEREPKSLEMRGKC